MHCQARLTLNPDRLEIPLTSFYKYAISDGISVDVFSPQDPRLQLVPSSEQNNSSISTMNFKFLRITTSIIVSFLVLLSELTVSAQVTEDRRPRLSRILNTPVTSGESIELKIVYSKDTFD